MQILALLKADAFKRCQLAIAPLYDVRSVGLSTLEARLTDSEAKLVIVDPSRIRPESFISLVQTARSQGSTTVMVHALLTADTARAVIRASLIQPIETVFFGSQDEQDALVQVCKKLMVPSVSALFLRGMAPNFAELPPPLATRPVGFLGGLPVPASTSAMLDGLGVASQTVHDWLAAVGIAHAHHLRSCLLLTRTFSELGRNRHRLEQIVEHADAGSVRAFRRACSTLTGLPPLQAGRLTEAEFARRLLSGLLGAHDSLRAATPRSGRKTS
jgi:hypothetical protein